ncbi:MAG: NAD(P)H-binding protein [Turneriella sp.]|nr:NAD(P)H-binding protein [Leptospiraceae bacterium]MCX7632802.1 NAD(P)H-binding protein [Turneriella sp.]
MDYVLAGATGLIGNEVLRLLVQEPQNRVFCLGRREPKLKSPNATFVAWDFTSPLRWAGVVPETPHAICTLGTTMKKAGSQDAFRQVDFGYVLAFARAMEQLGARSLHVVTAHGADPNSLFFYNRVKGETERELCQLSLPALHIYRPSLLLGERDESRPMESIAATVAGLISPLFRLPGLANVAPVPATRVAQAIVRACQNPSPGVHIHTNQEILQS